MEIEARFINLDRDDIERKLREIDAEKISDKFFREWLFYKKSWIDRNRRIRVRDDGKIVKLSYKENQEDTVDGTVEIEFSVPSAEIAIDFIRALDIPQTRYQEKKRITYQLRNITFDLDFWPQIPMVLEIEADSEAGVREGASLLGINWDDAIFIDQKALHKQYYGIDLEPVTDYSFKNTQ